MMKRKLHIGGKQAIQGWELLNVTPADGVDHVCNANNLAQFARGTFAEIYASHIVEHLDFKDELLPTLEEWHRVLEPNGKLYISVPDLDVLARLFADRDRLTTDERFMVMLMMFGGHVDEHDYHLVGLNEEFLRSFLLRAGFTNIVKVKGFGLFNDASNLIYKYVRISLNLVAEKTEAV